MYPSDLARIVSSARSGAGGNDRPTGPLPCPSRLWQPAQRSRKTARPRSAEISSPAKGACSATASSRSSSLGLAKSGMDPAGSRRGVSRACRAGWYHMSVRQSRAQPEASTSPRAASRNIAHLFRPALEEKLLRADPASGDEDADAVAGEPRIEGDAAPLASKDADGEQPDEVGERADQHRHLEDDDEKGGKRHDGHPADHDRPRPGPAGREEKPEGAAGDGTGQRGEPDQADGPLQRGDQFRERRRRRRAHFHALGAQSADRLRRLRDVAEDAEPPSLKRHGRPPWHRPLRADDRLRLSARRWRPPAGASRRRGTR